ncbi:MAG: helix-turn-helix transcriptional regulator [Endozoicomonadaceae bacterium]|nr:helix-turn-helix transcriptional regulator [Endozoicomonadaceae bacterium]
MAKKICDIDSCAVRDALQIIGGKWKNRILYVIVLNGHIRFNALRRSLPEISQKMLTQQLRELERDGIVLREAYPEVPLRVEYSMTPIGESIGLLYKAINLWQQDNFEYIKKSRLAYDRKKR